MIHDQPHADQDQNSGGDQPVKDNRPPPPYRDAFSERTGLVCTGSVLLLESTGDAQCHVIPNIRNVHLNSEIAAPDCSRGFKTGRLVLVHRVDARTDKMHLQRFGLRDSTQSQITRHDGISFAGARDLGADERGVRELCSIEPLGALEFVRQLVAGRLNGRYRDCYGQFGRGRRLGIQVQHAGNIREKPAVIRKTEVQQGETNLRVTRFNGIGAGPNLIWACNRLGRRNGRERCDGGG